ncbi:MAG: gliding motility-associated C-terminal domain-containing protein [Chitinophagales bacterium]
MRFVLSIVLASLFTALTFAQSTGYPGVAWGGAIGGNLPNSEEVLGIKSDGFGNTYITGYYLGTEDLDFGPGQSIVSSPGASSATFVSKYDINGNHLWSRIIASTNLVYPKAIAVDYAGNVVIGGEFEGRIDLDPGVGVDTFQASSGSSSLISTYTAHFLVSLNSNGDYNWGIAYDDNGPGGSTGSNLLIQDIECDLSGDIYVTGALESTVDLDPSGSIQTVNTVFAPGYKEGYVAKYSGSGQFQWVQQLYCSLTFSGQAKRCFASIEVDSLSNSYVAMGFGQSTIFPLTLKNRLGIQDFTSSCCNGQNDEGVLIYKIDSNGHILWIQNTSHKARYIDLDLNGSEIALLANGDNLNSGLNLSLFDTSGVIQEILELGPSHLDGTSLSYDGQGNLYMAFSIRLANSNQIDLHPSIDTLLIWQSQGFESNDQYAVVKLDNQKNFDWGLCSSSSGYNTVRCLNADVFGNAYVGGQFFQSADLDLDTLSDLVVTAPGVAGFFYKLGDRSPCDSLSLVPVVFDLFGCDSVTLNGNTYYSSQVVVDSLTSADGCDSIVITNLSIGSADVLQSQTAVCSGDTVLLSTASLLLAQLDSSNIESGLGYLGIPYNDLLSYYPFSNSYGDLGSLNNDLIDQNVLFVNDRISDPLSAVELGTNSVLRAPAPLFLDSAVDDFTISFWFKTDSQALSNFGGYMNLISGKARMPQFTNPNFVTKYSYESLIYIYDDPFSGLGPQIGFDNGFNFGEFSANGILINDAWNYLVMTKNEDTARMYLNGALLGYTLLDTTVASACIFGPGLNGNTYSYYGINRCVHEDDFMFQFVGATESVNTANNIVSYQSTFEGEIDDISIWRRALTPTQIGGLYDDINQSILWSTGETSPSITISPSQSETISVTITNGSNGCTDSAFIAVFSNSGDSVTASSCTDYTWQGQLYSSSGQYEDTLTSANGCDSIVSLNLTINSSFNSTDIQSSCDSFTWIDGVTYFSSTSLPSLTYTTQEGCDSTINLDLTISPILDIQAGGDTAVCEGDTVVLTATGAPNLSWSQGVDNGVPFVPSSTETYIVIGSSGNNCDGSDTVIITVNEVPTITSNVTDVSTSFDGSIDIDVSGGNPPYAFDWDNDGLGDIDDSEDIVFLDTGSYMVTVYDNNGCEVMAQFTVSKDGDDGYDQTIVITPNGDGQNETVDFDWLDNYPNSEVLILNRWGQAIYSSDGPSASWDGTYEGEVLPPADYYYIIDLGDGSAPQTGTITLKH